MFAHTEDWQQIRPHHARATIKALPSPQHRPRPYGHPTLFRVRIHLSMFLIGPGP